MSDEIAYPGAVSEARRRCAPARRPSVGVLERSRRGALAADRVRARRTVRDRRSSRQADRHWLCQSAFADRRAAGRRAGLEHALDRSLIVHRLNIALALRERLYAEPYYRLVFGESRRLAGLTLDRFGDVLVGQITTAGMERMKDAITEAIVKVIKPRQLGGRTTQRSARWSICRAMPTSATANRRAGRSCAKAVSNSRSIRSAARRPAGSTISAKIATASRAS